MVWKACIIILVILNQLVESLILAMVSSEMDDMICYDPASTGSGKCCTIQWGMTKVVEWRYVIILTILINLNRMLQASHIPSINQIWSACKFLSENINWR